MIGYFQKIIIIDTIWQKIKGKDDLIINLSDGDGLTLWATHTHKINHIFVNNNNKKL